MVNIENIPLELKEYPHWICWEVQIRDGKETKVPFSPHGGMAKTDDPSTWATFEQAKTYCEKHPNLSGIGYVFSVDDPFCGIDLDKCRNPEIGEINADAQKIIDDFASYTEISPSGKGIHIILKGKKPGPKCRKGKIEIYDTERYFTFTGNVLKRPDSARSLPHEHRIFEFRQEQLNELYNSLFAKEEKPEVLTEGLTEVLTEGLTAKPQPLAKPQPQGFTGKPAKPFAKPQPLLEESEHYLAFSATKQPQAIFLDDQELIEKAKNAKDGGKFTALWEGDISGYPSHSEADLALCCLLAFWTRGDYERIDRLFRQSGLYRDDKWSKREDYREKTINRALENTTEYYDQNKQKSQESEQHGVSTQEVTPKQSSVVKKDEKVRDEKRVHHLLFLAKRYHQQKLRRKEILALLQKESEAKCEPCLSEAEINIVLDKVLPRLQTITAAELLDMDIPEPKWAIPQFIPEGLTILAGRPKVGKSWLALSFCAAVAMGGYALGKVQVEQGEALFIGLEDNYRRLQDRFFQLCEGERPSNLHLLLDLPKLDRGGLDVLGDWLDEHPNVRLVVVDTLQKVKPGKRGRSSDLYGEDYDFTGMLQRFAIDRGVALICVHHTRKAEADYLLDELSGTTGISAGADCILMLKRKLDGHILYRTGRDVEEGEFAVRRDNTVGGWELLGEAKEFAVSEQRRAIIEVLREADAPMSSKEIAEALSKQGGAVRKLLFSMFRNKRA